MGARIRCPRCNGTGKRISTESWQVDCGLCQRGWIELPVEQIAEALKPHLANGFNVLKKRLIAYAQQRKVQKAIESAFKNIGR